MRRNIKWAVSVAAIAASLTAGVGVGRAANSDLNECGRFDQQDAKIGCYTRILDAESTAPEIRVDAYYLRGLAFAIQGKYEQAIADAAEAIDINPKYEKAYLARALVYHQKGEVDLAIADYDRAIDLAPRDADALINRASLYDRKGDHDGAIREFDALLAMDSAQPMLSEVGHSFAYLNRGVAHFNRGEFDQAIADAGKAIEFNPKLSYAYLNRGRAYQAKGKYSPAIADFDKAIEVNSTSAFFYYYRGIAHRSKNEFTLAIADFQKAMELDPKFTAAQIELGRTYVEAGRAALARWRNWIMGG